MDIEKMSFDEKKEYLISLIELLNEKQLKKALGYLKKLIKEQEGGNEKQV